MLLQQVSPTCAVFVGGGSFVGLEAAAFNSLRVKRRYNDTVSPKLIMTPLYTVTNLFTFSFIAAFNH